MFRKKYQKEHILWGWLFIFPTFIGLLFLNIIPAFQTFYLSFRKSAGFGNTVYAGLSNYKKLLGDAEVFQALLNTFKYALVSIPLIVAFSLLFAVLLNKKIRGVSFYRTLYFLPVVAAPSAVAMVWKWMFNSNFGVINNLLAKVGLGPVSWLTDPNVAIYAVIIVGVWSAVGYNMVLLLAGLQEIPAMYYEAADLDGASAWHQFRNITLPLVTPSLFFVVVTTVINSLQVFDAIFMMVPQYTEAMTKTQSLAYLFYKHSFMLNDKGYGSAIVILLLVIILIITVIQLQLQKRWVHY